MLRITITANAHQPRSAGLGLAGLPVSANRSPTIWPNSQQPVAQVHNVQRLRSGPVATRRAMKVPASAAIAAAVQANPQQIVVSGVSSPTAIATIASPAGTATAHPGRAPLLTP